jgi:hypothetical protein
MSAELDKVKLHIVRPDEQPEKQPEEPQEEDLLTRSMGMEKVTELLNNPTTPPDLLLEARMREPYLKKKLGLLQPERVQYRVVDVLANAVNVVFEDGSTGSDYLSEEIPDRLKGPEGKSPRFIVKRRLLNREFGIPEVLPKQAPRTFPRR